MQIAYQIFSSPLGEILVAGTDFAITHVKRGDDRASLSADFRMEHDNVNPMGRNDYIKDACNAITSYLEGRSRSVDVAIQVGGTEFQRKVWHALRQIPYGATFTYSAVAQEIGSPDAFRAVANACGDNPVPLIIPCHRVVHKSADMTGFGWGKEAKRFLLDLEKAHVGAGLAQTA